MSEKQIIIESRLSNDWDFCKLCLLKLYEQQTADEQGDGITHHDNGKGFTKGDSIILSFWSEGLLNHIPRPVAKQDKHIIQLRMHKYAKQLTTLLTDEEIGL